MRTDSPARSGRIDTWVRRPSILLALGIAGAVALPASVEAQVIDLCGIQMSPSPESLRCGGAVRSADRIQTLLALGHGGGAPLPGSVSTLGRRFGSTPRVALAGQVGFSRFDVPNPDNWASSGDDAVMAPTLSISLGVGVIEGFSLAPTVGGLFSVDLLADLSTMRLPSGDGFGGASTSYGFGVRVGLLRESFTLPGASVSVMRRLGASASVSGTDGSLESEVNTTSIRAVVGKEVLGFGIFGGAGWDRASADWSAQIRGDGAQDLGLSINDDKDTVHSYFGGITRTFLVTQVGLEAGWTEGLFFGSIGLRLTL